MYTMMRNGFWVIVLWVVASSFALADGFREQFRLAFRTGDLAAAEKVLTAWEKANAKDPDLYVARFNLLLKQAERVETRPAATAANAGGAPNAEPKPVKITRYDPATMTQAAEVLKKGIALAPERLDMRFGLAKSYEMVGQPAPLLQTLREALEHRAKGGKPWLWRDGAALPGPEEAFVPAAMEPFASALWKVPNNNGLEYGRPIAEMMEKYFPQNSLGYFNMGVYYGHLNKTQEAYDKMQQADALQPNDVTTVVNLSRYAIVLKQKDAAVKYVERLRKMPSGGPMADAFTKEIQKL